MALDERSFENARVTRDASGYPATWAWRSANRREADAAARLAAVKSYLFACARRNEPPDLRWLVGIL